MEFIEQALAQHPFLEGMDKRYLRQLARFASVRKFKALQPIFHEGEEANEFFLIRKGTVAIEMAMLGLEGIQIQTLGEGEALGWSWLFPPYQWHFSARAVEPTEMFALDGKALRARCEEDHDLGYEIMKRFSQVVVHRLAATRLRFLNFPDPRPAAQAPPVPFPILDE